MTRAFPLALLLMVPPGMAQAPSPASAPPVSPTPSPRRTVEFDLLAPAGDAPAVVTAPRSEFFWAVLKNRAPSGSYRVTFDWVLAPTTTTRPPAAGLHSTSELMKPNAAGLHVAGFSPACDEFQARGQDVLRTTDEREMPERVAAFRARSAKHDCPQLEGMNREVDMFASAEIPRVFSVYEGDEIRYVVERLDPATKAVLKTWRFTVRAEPPRLAWAYPNEEAWIVGETSRDIVEMILFARDHSLPPSDGLRFAVAADPPATAVPRYTVSWAPAPGSAEKQALTFETYIWSPASYEPLAVGMIRSRGLKPAAATPEGLLAGALIRPTARMLAGENARLSQRLTQAMLDAGAHEQAALVLGTLALRETAGGFSDVRQTLCRMSAHLAVARALRGGAPSPLAGYADALLLTLVERQRDALARIDGLEQARPSPEWAAVLRALRVRNTRDWRILKDPAKATLLERLEQYRALRRSLGPSPAMSFLETFAPEPIGDWGRIAFEYGASVEQGQVFGESLIALDLGEMREAWKIVNGGRELPPEGVVEALNARPSRLVAAQEGKATPQVIGWGTWARFFQRQIAFDAEGTVTFLEHMLGLPQDAQRLRDSLAATLGGLELWPALAVQPLGASAQARIASLGTPADRGRHEACDRAVALIQSAPETMSPHFWQVLEQHCFEARQSQALMPLRTWFGGLVPAGTALVPPDRMYLLATTQPRQDPGPQYMALHELAPFDLAFIAGLPPEPGADRSAGLAARYGPLAEYDLGVMESLAWARRSDHAAFQTLYAKVVAIEPDKYTDLALALVDFGLEDEAAAAFEKSIEMSRERVGLSTDLIWLVGYYLDRSRTARAEEVAKLAADVGSGGGLQAIAYFQERMGRYAEAEKSYQAIVERYGDESQRFLDGFYIRHERRVADGRFHAEATAAMARVFPAGLERVTLAELSGPPDPRNAVRISGAYENSTRFGLLKDDVVVAFNGYRVHTDPQYQTLLTLDDRPEATAIVWRQGRYIEVKGVLKRRSYAPASRPV